MYWIGSYESGLIRCTGLAACEEMPIPGEPSAYEISSLRAQREADGSSSIWAGTDNGATRLHVRGDLRTVRRLSEDSNGVWAVRFEPDPDGTERLWLGSDGEGLWRYQNGAWTQFSRADGLPGDIVRSISRLADGYAVGWYVER